MIINDLEHLESVAQAQEVEGGMFPDFSAIIGKSLSAFSFNSLASGAWGAFAGGEPKILTTAFDNNYSVGFQFTYSSVAIGLPLELAL